MMKTDSYFTIGEGAVGTYKEKGSKFIALVRHVENEQDFKDFLEETRKKYYDARHHCWAWRLGPEDDSSRSNDDGEPSGSAGKPILNQILSLKIYQVAVIVVRYFGGTKLGVSGLINAYKTSSREALELSAKRKRILAISIELKFEYPRLNDIMRVVKEENAQVEAQDFGISCLLRINVRKSNAERVLSSLERFYDVEIKRL